MYLSREMTSLSLADIARHFNRDHTTIIHAVRTVSARAATDADVSDTIHRVRELLGTEPPATPALSPSSLPRPHSPSTDEIP
jgi:chromosomal replication initiator protein